MRAWAMRCASPRTCAAALALWWAHCRAVVVKRGGQRRCEGVQTALQSRRRSRHLRRRQHTKALDCRRRLAYLLSAEAASVWRARGWPRNCRRPRLLPLDAGQPRVVMTRCGGSRHSADLAAKYGRPVTSPHGQPIGACLAPRVACATRGWRQRGLDRKVWAGVPLRAWHDRMRPAVGVARWQAFAHTGWSVVRHFASGRCRGTPLRESPTGATPPAKVHCIRMMSATQPLRRGRDGRS
jgi:hypothetical protein